jgi:tetratricopeptide (TPR) repeat protein
MGTYESRDGAIPNAPPRRSRAGLSPGIGPEPELCAGTHATIGWLLAVRGANGEAVQSAERALRLTPSDPRVGATASHVIAFARFSAKQYSDCVGSARELIERYPEYHPARYVLISAAAMNGDIDAASDALADPLRLQPDFSLAWLAEVMPWTGEIGDRLLEGWRKAGVPE